MNYRRERVAALGAVLPWNSAEGLFLLDTNVVSELRRRRPHGAVLAWMAGVADMDLFVSVVTIGEIQAGIEATRAQDLANASEIEAWLDQVVGTFQVLPMDAGAFRVWGRLMHRWRMR